MQTLPGMNDTTAFKHHAGRLLSLALLLSLTACEPDEEAAEGTMRVKYGETWKEFDDVRDYTFHPEPAPKLILCGTNDPLPNAIDDETGLCVDVTFDPAIPGSGPATFTIDGTATVPSPDSGPNRTFEAGPAHTAGLAGVWASTSCYSSPSEEDVVQQVSGELELEENSATRLKGRLVLDVTGTTGLTCPGSAAEVDLHFDIARQVRRQRLRPSSLRGSASDAAVTASMPCSPSMWTMRSFFARRRMAAMY